MKTIKVRIACAVDGSGHWNACGYDRATYEDLVQCVVEPVGWPNIVHFIEAEVPVPESQIIKGEVK